jgi:hypothetical protein
VFGGILLLLLLLFVEPNAKEYLPETDQLAAHTEQLELSDRR